jgi:hypothetical protein
MLAEQAARHAAADVKLANELAQKIADPEKLDHFFEDKDYRYEPRRHRPSREGIAKIAHRGHEYSKVVLKHGRVYGFNGDRPLHKQLTKERLKFIADPEKLDHAWASRDYDNQPQRSGGEVNYDKAVPVQSEPVRDDTIRETRVARRAGDNLRAERRHHRRFRSDPMS